jgi:hypothetical protein
MMSRLLYSTLVVFGLAACSKIPDFDSRYGPGPTIPADAVTTKVDIQTKVMDYLYGKAVADQPRNNANNLWYEATLLGFNYVDEECSEFLRLNFRLTRMRDRDKSMLDAFSNTSAGLLKAASVADPTITSVSAAFGLGSALTSAYLGSYLFSMEPNIVFRTVTKLQNGYRKQVDAGKAEINSSATAYRTIQNYYTLCFPQTIEAKMSEFLAQAASEDDAAEKGGTPSNGRQTRGKTDQHAKKLPTTIDPRLVTQ